MTSWEREILVVLANHVRMLSLSQVARSGGPKIVAD